MYLQQRRRKCKKLNPGAIKRLLHNIPRDRQRDQQKWQSDTITRESSEYQIYIIFKAEFGNI